MAKQIKSITDFVEAIKGEVTLDGSTDYSQVQAQARKLLGGQLGNEQVWKVVNQLKSATVTLLDD